MLAQLTRRAPRQSVLTASELQAQHEHKKLAVALMVLALPITAFWVVTNGPAAWDPTVASLPSTSRSSRPRP